MIIITFANDYFRTVNIFFQFNSKTLYCVHFFCLCVYVCALSEAQTDKR